jgi:hypothetical protein
LNVTADFVLLLLSATHAHQGSGKRCSHYHQSFHNNPRFVFENGQAD